MDPVGIGGLILSAVGVALSCWALMKADSAEKAVAKVIGRAGDQKARDDARELLMLISAARDAAMSNRRGAPQLASAGRVRDNDIQAIQKAQDALATLNVTDDQQVTKKLRRSGLELNKALQEINGDGVRDGWADALAVLQGVTPQVDVLQRGLGSKALG
jgi:hypothetical protein